jgi:TctA family transporter
LLLAFVLAPMLETEMRRAFVISRGSLSIFIEKPISLGFLLATLALILSPLVIRGVKKIIKMRAGARQN